MDPDQGAIHEGRTVGTEIHSIHLLTLHDLGCTQASLELRRSWDMSGSLYLKFQFV
jgi:hypothetical protein